MMNPDLSIILVNWNAQEVTSAALASIKEFTSGIIYEVFVVDNGTTRDKSVTELPARFPWITFIANSDNRGFSKANNQGIRLAKGRYVLLLNNDTVQTENALGESVRYMDSHPEIGALGIRHLNDDALRSPQSSYFTFPDPLYEIGALLGLSSNGRPTLSPEQYPREAEVDWIVGSYLFMRRECLEQVGELDERFFIYDEDVDWCLRAHKAGWKIGYWGGVSMLHIGSAAKPFMKDKTFIHFRSHLSFYLKHSGLFFGAAYYLTMGLRLTRASLGSILYWIIAKGTFLAVKEKVWRQWQFMSLQSGKSGGS